MTRLEFALVALLVALGVSMIAGCAQTPPPAIQVQTVTVDRVVRVACVNRADIPPEPPHVTDSLTGKAGHDLLVVDQSALDLRTWGESLDAMLLGCATVLPSATNRPGIAGNAPRP